MAKVAMTIRGNRAQWFLLVAWALMSGLEFPKPNLWVLAHVSLVPLTLLGLRGRPWWRAAWKTYVVAWVWWALMLYWIGPLTGPGYVALAAYKALYPLAFVLLLPAIQRRFDPPLMLSVPVLWVGLEWLRGTYFMTGFPWFLQGQSQPTWFIQTADIVGAYGISFLVCMTSGLICDIVTRPLVVRGSDGTTRRSKAVVIPLMAWLLMVLGSITYGAFRIVDANMLDGIEPYVPIRIAVVQTNVPQSNKIYPTEEQDRKNFEEMLRLSEQALADKPDVIAWPETMVPDPINEESVHLFEGPRYYRSELDRFVREHHVALVVGGHAYEKWSKASGRWDNYERYNSAFLLAPDRGDQRYDKIHRVPFGEYVPWEGFTALHDLLLTLVPEGYRHALTQGKSFTVFEMRAGEKGEEVWHLAAPICFEDVVSEVPRRMVWDEGGGKRVDVLVNISNDGWFAGTSQAAQHEQIARFRCVENRVPMARAVNTGVSGFIDSAGRVVGRVEVDGKRQRVAGVATGELFRDDRVTLYSRIGDAVPVGCVFVVLALIGDAIVDRLRKVRYDKNEATVVGGRVR